MRPGQLPPIRRARIIRDGPEEFWRFLEEALRLLVHAKSIRLLIDTSDAASTRASRDGAGEYEYPDRFIDIIGSVFNQRVTHLQAQLDSDQLFRLCRTLPLCAPRVGVGKTGISRPTLLHTFATWN